MNVTVRNGFFFICVLVACFWPASSFLWDKEVDIVRSEWSSVVVVVRHVEYIGVIDNGTLDCGVPGFTKYRWTIINKATKDGFTESYIMGSGDEKIPESQSQLKIGGNDGFPLVNDLMVVSCEALVGLHPYMQIIWAITRLHSPLGYPTDPRVCDFGGKTFETNCTWYQWTYKTDCYYNKGLEYSGSMNRAKHLKCKYWHMSTGSHHESHVFARLMGIFEKGGHDYCRNIAVNPSCYIKKRKIESCRQNILTQPWCFSDDNPDEKPYQIHYCNVKECSSCIYGNGDGTFKLYPKKKFPEYLGRSITTTKKSNGNPVLCLQGIGWEDNVCRTSIRIKTKSMDKPHVVTKTTPHCYVAKPGVDTSKIKKVPDKNLELASCHFRQCTVRQVWFLFFNTYGKPFFLESNFKGIQIELVAGRKEERIKFAAFGVHLTNGLKLGSQDYTVSNYLGSFSLIVRRPPDKMSELVIKNIKKQYSGKYFMEYKFAEADPKTDQATYKVNFEIDVKQPTRFSLSPSVLKVCLKGNGKITASVNGHFPILDDTIRWKYGTSRAAIKTDILPHNTCFELSSNAKSLVTKSVTEGLWVSVEGRSYSGLTLAVAQISLKDQPFLKPVSPLTQYALHGDDVTLMIESNQLQPVVWVFDAMVIQSLPDDPNMGFRRIARGNNVVTSLVISDVKEHHYGKYYVEATLDGCKSVITFQVQHSSENPEFANMATKRPAMAIDFNRTGLWCTDELDPYAFYFNVEFQSLSTIGAFRNEPLTDSKAVEIQHYSIKYSIDGTSWKRFVLKQNISRIPYTFLGNKIQWLLRPMTARYLRIYPERLDSTACMRVKFFGCKGRSLDCDEIKEIEEPLPLELIIGIPSGVVPLMIIIAICLWRRQHADEETDQQKERKRKISKRKRKHKSLEEDRDSRKKRKKKVDAKKADKGDEDPKEKRRRYVTSSDESSFELDSEEEREIRRKAKLKAKKKEIEMEERLRLKRKIAKQRKRQKSDKNETENDSGEESNKTEPKNKSKREGKKSKGKKRRERKNNPSKRSKEHDSNSQDKLSTSKENKKPARDSSESESTSLSESLS